MVLIMNDVGCEFEESPLQIYILKESTFDLFEVPLGWRLR